MYHQNYSDWNNQFVEQTNIEIFENVRDMHVNMYSTQTKTLINLIFR